MKLFRKISDAPYAALAALSVFVFAATEEAQATMIGDKAGTITTQIASIGKLVIAGSFLIGVIMVAAGLMKLKQAADTQGQQVKYGEGLWRLAVGAGLVAVPALTGVLVASGGMTASAPTGYEGF